MVAFVQATGGGGSYTGIPATLTPPAPPTPGNFLLLIANGSQSADVFAWILPPGWTVDYSLGQSGDTDLSNMLIARHVVGPSDGPSVVVDTSFPVGPAAGLILAEYSGMGPAPALDTVLDQGFIPDNAPVIAGPLVPAQGVPRLLVCAAARHPNYAIGAPVGGSGFTNRQEANQGGSRQTFALLDLITPATAGGYTCEFQAHADSQWRVPMASYAPGLGLAFPPGYW